MLHPLANATPPAGQATPVITWIEPSRKPCYDPPVHSILHRRNVTKIIHGPYLSDLLRQGDVLREVCTALSRTEPLHRLREQLQNHSYRRIVMTGMGSSFHAFYPLHLRLTRAGFVSHHVETAELLLGFEAFKSHNTLLIVTSQSGESAEVVALLRDSHAFGHVVGITNQPSSTLGRTAQTVLPLHAGEEATVSCKTYLATLAVLHWLGAVLTGGSPEEAVRALTEIEGPMRAYLEHYKSHVAALGGVLTDIRSVYVVGRGVSLATTGTGGLILKESTRQPAEGMSAAAFRHGVIEMVGPHALVFVLEGQPEVADLHRRLATEITHFGGQVILIGSDAGIAAAFRIPRVPVPLLPLVEILPVQMLSLAIAARDGREAGRFKLASKVTTII